MRVERVGLGAPRRATLQRAAEMLRAGRLVAFPTETVYGLGAHALDETAVRRIYEAKGRPSINPLIVHVANVEAARALSKGWSESAEALAVAFWPGPITLVVRKRAVIPELVTAGRDTVGLRVPSHPVALELLEEASIPVAAPSANLSNQVSPTTAQHVVRGMGARVDFVLDGGATPVGIESTVVDVTGKVPRVLRPGMISRDDIAKVAGDAELASPGAGDDVPRSPGLVGRHYAPRAIVRLFTHESRDIAMRDARLALGQLRKVGAMTFTSLPIELSEVHTMPADPGAYARALYATLHALDASGCEVILIERPPASAQWAGITDRLDRAAT